MAATVGTKRTIPFTIGVGATVGQGSKPELWALLNYNDIATGDEAGWVDVTADVRSFSWSRGRESELSDMGAGTASVVLDNRNNDYDPGSHAYIRPMNRLWLREQFSGLTNDLFKGYVESYQQSWPEPGSSDALTTVNAVDEFKPLALDELPLLPVGKENYKGVVSWWEPAGYWPMDDSVSGQAVHITQQRRIGPHHRIGGGKLYYPEIFPQELAVSGSPLGFLSIGGGTLAPSTTLLFGEPWFETAHGALALSGVGQLGCEVTQGGAGDVGGLNEFGMEMWFRFNALTPGSRFIVQGPNYGAASPAYSLVLLPSGAVQATATNSVPTTYTVTSAVLDVGRTYHLFAVISGGSLRLYVNGVQVGSTAFSGSFQAFFAGSLFGLGPPDTGQVFTYDEVAFYRYGVSASGVSDHYTAGTARGWTMDDTDRRISKVLDLANSHGRRYIRAGARLVQARYMHGQDPLSELRTAEAAEAGDAVLFIGKDGAVVFLDANHRSVAPWTTVQSTFGDEGTAGQWPYADLAVDYSESFLFNDWSVTAEGGSATQNRNDGTSISRYGRRAQSLVLPLVYGADADSVAAAMLAKYKDPMQRITSITLTTDDPNVTHEVFQRELCDRIRVIKTLPGGGWFDQQLFIQKIDGSATNDQGPWTIRLGVSPL